MALRDQDLPSHLISGGNLNRLERHKWFLSWPVSDPDFFNRYINCSSQGNCLNGREHLEPSVKGWNTGRELQTPDSSVYSGHSRYATLKRQVLLALAEGVAQMPGRGRQRSEPSRAVVGPESGQSFISVGEALDLEVNDFRVLFTWG